MSRTFKLTIAYDGTDFAGWQVQPGQETVQGLLQSAIGQITGQTAQAIGSGRTDSGVHAIAQVASCELPQWKHSAEDLRRAINTQLPETIVVNEIVDAPEGFHAIRDATGKRYRYQLQVGGTREVFDYRYRWHLKGAVEIDRMREAADHFLGRHDFESFQAAGSDRKTTTRTIRACDLIIQEPARPTPGANDSGGMKLAIEIEADGFLYNMVRNVVGTLVEVGRGKHPPEWIDELIAARNRDVAGPTAPSQGLFLLRVDYAPFDS